MKVKYVSQYDKKPKSWLKEDKEYIVLEIFIDKNGPVYRILTEEGTSPGLYSANLFDISK